MKTSFNLAATVPSPALHPVPSIPVPWRDMLCPDVSPDKLAQQRKSVAQTLKRIDALPARLRDVMCLRVLQHQPTASVCKELAISKNKHF